MPDNKTSDQIKDWNQYWLNHKGSSRGIYDFIASFYRRFIIRPSLNRFVKSEFKENELILHAGCGSGQVDTDIINYVSIKALDISSNALNLYRAVNGNKAETVIGSIFALPFPDSAFDGIYNLGVMEHFTEAEIQEIFKEFRRVLKPGGRMIIFWPPEYGLSVIFFKMLSFIMRNIFFQKNIKFHPDEITRLKSKKHGQNILEQANIQFTGFYFGFKDLFTYAVLTGVK